MRLTIRVFRPGWSSQQMKMMNVDIRITEPGWTRVPIVQVDKLKVPPPILLALTLLLENNRRRIRLLLFMCLQRKAKIEHKILSKSKHAKTAVSFAL